MSGLRTRLKRLVDLLVGDQLRAIEDRSSFSIWMSHLQTARRQYSEAVDIREVGFSCFSQSNEDGILDFLTTRLGFDYSSTFLEIGTQDYAESNTRFLYSRLHCTGKIVDCCSRYNERVRRVLSDAYWKGRLDTVERFVTLENVRSIITHEYDLISIDIDGNDFWILAEILKVVSPKVLVCEYNPLFGTAKVSTPYHEDFNRELYHYSHLVFGMSLPAAIMLAEERGLVYIGSNSLHNNAFFIRKDCVSLLPSTFVIPSPECSRVCEVIVQEGRNSEGDLQLLDKEEIIGMLSNVEVCDLSCGVDKSEVVQLGSFWDS